MPPCVYSLSPPLSSVNGALFLRRVREQSGSVKRFDLLSDETLFPPCAVSDKHSHYLFNVWLPSRLPSGQAFTETKRRPSINYRAADSELTADWVSSACRIRNSAEICGNRPVFLPTPEPSVSRPTYPSNKDEFYERFTNILSMLQKCYFEMFSENVQFLKCFFLFFFLSYAVMLRKCYI